MKYPATFALVGLIAVTACFLGRRHRLAEAPPQPVAVEVEPAAEVLPVRSSQPAIMGIFQPPKPRSQFERTMLSLHAKLRKWRESETGDPDDEEGRARLLQEMLDMVTDENVAELTASLSAEEMNTPFGSGVLHHWMQTDPVAASNWLAKRPETTEDQTLAVAEEWAGNRDGLKQYLDQLPDSAWKQSLLQDSSLRLSTKDPTEAVKLAAQMNPGDAQTNLMKAVVCGWVSSDPDAALDWAAKMSDPAMREQVISSAVQSYALTNPAQAAAWLVQEVKSDGVVKDAAFNILNTWITTDPASAASWAAQFPEGDTKAAAVKLVSSHWLQTDPAAANAWIQKLSGISEASTN